MFLCVPKMFYVLVDKNNRYKLRLDRSKQIVSSKNAFERFLDAWISFNYQLSSKLDLTKDLMFVVKDKILNDIIFETLPFGVNDHLFFCNRYFYFEKYCCFCTRFHVRDKALSHFLNQKVTLPVLFFLRNRFLIIYLSLIMCLFLFINTA